jgi:hypothetical protein
MTVAQRTALLCNISRAAAHEAASTHGIVALVLESCNGVDARLHLVIATIEGVDISCSTQSARCCRMHH